MCRKVWGSLAMVVLPVDVLREVVGTIAILLLSSVSICSVESSKDRKKGLFKMLTGSVMCS